jgi:NADPH:quinone reductase-like Zn-dependent oxidoreductase
MRCVIAETTGGPEVLKVAERERPSPLPTEILVRVEAAGVNPVDWKTRAGKGMSHVLGDPPFVVGWDVAGTVEEVGFGVTRFEKGDRVFGMPWFPREAAAYAEFVTAPSRHFAHAPADADMAECAALPLAALTAWQVLIDTADVAEGSRVLIHAASGGVGHLAVQIAKARGAEVIGTSRAENHEFMDSIGVDRVVDYTNEAFQETVSGVDLAVDLVGTKDYGMRSLQTLREGGLLVQVPSGADSEVGEEAERQGKRTVSFLVEPDGAALEEIAKLVLHDQLTVEVAERIALDDAARAHEIGERGRTRGKLVLLV